MRSTITSHGHNLYSLDIWDDNGHLLRRIDGLTSTAQCRALVWQERQRAAGAQPLPGLDDLPSSAIVQQQTRLF